VRSMHSIGIPRSAKTFFACLVSSNFIPYAAAPHAQVRMVFSTSATVKPRVVM